MVGIVHQQVHFAYVIATADAVHIPQVGPIHPNQEVEFVVIGVGEPPRRFPGAVDHMLGQLPAGPGDRPGF